MWFSGHVNKNYKMLYNYNMDYLKTNCSVNDDFNLVFYQDKQDYESRIALAIKDIILNIKDEKIKEYFESRENLLAIKNLSKMD